MKKLILAGMLAAFGAALMLPVVIGSDDALAAAKKKPMDKAKMEKEKNKKPTGKM